MSLIYIIEIIGTFVFSISGVLTAVDKKFDLVGATIIGMVTAIGGGTVRDMLIGNTPVAWLKDINIIIAIFLSVPICYFFKTSILKFKKSTFLFDTIGIGMFTVIGLQKTLDVGLSPLSATLMGIVSAVFGGVVRDVLCNEIPLIFRREIYATACLLGAVTYLGLEYFFPGEWNLAISTSVVIIIRYLAVRNKWALPFNPLEK